MVDLTKVVVALEAETARYQRELDRANKKFNRFAKQQKRGLEKLSSQFGTLAVGVKIFYAALAGSAAIRAARRTFEIAENLNLLATRLNVSARELQAWQLIADRFGVNAQTLNLSIQRLRRRVSEAAAGFGEARGALRELGIDATRFNQLGLDDQFFALARAFDEVENKSDQLRLAFKLFDSEGAAVLQFFSEGEKGLEKLRQQLEGQLWSDEERARLEKANQQLKELEQRFQLLSGEVAAFVLDAGEGFSSWLADAVAQTSLLGLLLQKLIGPIKQVGQTRNLLDPTVSRSSSDDAIAFAAGFQTSGDFALRDKSSFRNSVDFAIDKAIEVGEALTSTVKSERAFMAALEAEIAQIQDNLRQGYAETLASIKKFNEDQAEELKELEDKYRDTFVDLFTENLVQAANMGFKEILRSWVNTLIQMELRLLASKIFDLLGGSTGVLGGFLKFFGGARADGGPVSGGRGYLVGERGPELFIPRTSGSIVPNGAGGAMVFNIDARGAVPGMEMLIRRGVEQAVVASQINEHERRRRGRM